jgi:hypothetical protein
MARCSCGEDCEITCTGGCGCIYVWEEEHCLCTCFDSSGGRRGNLGLSATVDVSVKGLPLSTLAAHVNRLTGREILVPVSKANKRVNLRLKKVRLRAAIKKLGLRT